MRLSKKTFFYSIFISSLLILFIILYFAFMLPSLYVKHVEKENLDSLVNVQRGYIKNRSYNGLVVKNPTGSTTIEVPLTGNRIYVAAKMFRITVNIEDEELRDILEQVRTSAKGVEGIADIEVPDVEIEKLKEKLLPENNSELLSFLSFQVDVSEDTGDTKQKKEKIHVISDSTVIFEGGIEDGDNHFTSYIAASKTEDAFIFSFLPVMTPQMKEIRPIVLDSLPMITAVVFLMVLVSSQIFSRKIVNPVIQLANYAEEVKTAGNIEMEPLKIEGKDEIGELGKTLNELYQKLRSQYQELEQKNQALKRENKRQEVFLRASSHQLKTPITAALLLVDGMLAEIGKYKDTKKYMPEVKKQLLSMRKIVEDILYLNHCADHIQKEQVDLHLLVREVVDSYKIQAGVRCLHFTYNESKVTVYTDREIMKKILDNLISNTVSYTPKGGLISIRMHSNFIEVYNEGAQIDEAILPHIYDPFVSSDTRQKGRGLGLYVISYYTELLGLQIQITNEENGVLARLELE